MARANSKARQIRRGSSGARILVVDDAEGIRTYLANLLELKGYQVDTAEDGRSALSLLAAGAAPDVVLLDVMMPGIDGIETLRQIREQHGRLPVVMLSVVGRASTIVEAMQRPAPRPILRRPTVALADYIEVNGLKVRVRRRGKK